MKRKGGYTEAWLLCPSHLCLWIAFLFLLLKKQQHLRHKNIRFLGWNAKIFTHHQVSLLLLDVSKFFLRLLLNRWWASAVFFRRLQCCESGANGSHNATYNKAALLLFCAVHFLNYNSLERLKPEQQRPPSTAEPYLASSATSTSTLAVIGAFECPAVGSSVFSSPLVELTTWEEEHTAKGGELNQIYQKKTYFSPV